MFLNYSVSYPRHVLSLISDTVDNDTIDDIDSNSVRLAILPKVFKKMDGYQLLTNGLGSF
jgi:hypothetical protein